MRLWLIRYESFERIGDAIKRAVQSAGEGETIRAELSVSSSEKVCPEGFQRQARA